MSENINLDIINEPPFPYHELRISTLENLEQENRFYSLNLAPEERIKYLHELNINAFGKASLLLNDFGNKLIFNR